MNPNLMRNGHVFSGKSYASEYIRSTILKIQEEANSVPEDKSRRSVLVDAPLTPSAPVEFDRPAYMKSLLNLHGGETEQRFDPSKAGSSMFTVNNNYDGQIQAEILEAQAKKDIAEARLDTELVNAHVESVEPEKKVVAKKRKVAKGKGKRNANKAGKAIKSDICSSPGSTNPSDDDE